MKQTIILLIVLLSVISISKAQLDGSGIAPDFTLTDVEGNEHNLYSYLDDGKSVVLDFFSVWCGTCMESVPGIQKFYTNHGQDGDNSSMVLGIEAETATDMDDVEIFLDNYAPTYPIINESGEVSAMYQVNVFPVIYVICPDRSYRVIEVDPDHIFTALEENTGVCQGISSLGNDAKALEFTSPSGAYCFGHFVPSFTLQNYGQNELTSVEIHTYLDGEYLDMFLWEGSLQQYEIDIVNLPDVVDVENKDHTFTFELQLPNGVADENADNNILYADFEMTADGAGIVIELTTDDLPEETGWVISNESETLLEINDFTEANQTYITEFCLENDHCYFLTLYDDNGNGMEGNGGLKLFYNDIEYLVITSDEFNSYGTTISFCTADLLPPEMSFYPPDGAENTELDVLPKIMFSKPIRKADDSELTNADLQSLLVFKQTDETGANVAFLAEINDEKTEITIAPETELQSNQIYFLTLSETLEDEIDQELSLHSSSFATINLLAPVVSCSVGEGSVGIAADEAIVFGFDKAIRNLDDSEITNENAVELFDFTDEDENTVVFTATVNESKTEITITPQQAYSSETVYTISIDAVAEDENDVSIVPFQVSFTSADVLAPVASFSVEDGEIGVATDAVLMITFDESIRFVDDSEIENEDLQTLIQLKKDDQNGEDVVFSATINPLKTLIIINPENELESLQNYYLAVLPQIEDEHDNSTELLSVNFTTDVSDNIPQVNLEHGIQIYPNPADDFLYFENLREVDNVEIFNYLGTLVYKKQKNIDFQVIDISKLKAGVYFVVIEDNDKKSVRKLFVK